MENIGIWIAAFLTLSIYSFLYKDNPLYKLVEHLFVGVSAGYWIAFQWNNVLYPDLFLELGKGNLWTIIPGLLAICMLLRLVPNVAWVSRYALAFIVASTAGNAIFQNAQSDILPQVQAAFRPLIAFEEVITTEQTKAIIPKTDSPNIVRKEEVKQETITASREKVKVFSMKKSINNILFVVGLLCTLFYFFFSVEHTGRFKGGMARIGVYYLMITFGAMFGYTVMGRISLLIGRMQFLLGDWLGLLG